MEAHQPHLCLDSAYFISLGGGCGIKGSYTRVWSVHCHGNATINNSSPSVLTTDKGPSYFFAFFLASDFLWMTTKLGLCCSHYSPAYEDTEQVEERLPWKLSTLLPLQ